MTYQSPRLLHPDQDRALVTQLAKLQEDCILKDHAVLTFLPPLHRPDLINYWEHWLREIESGIREIIVQTYTHPDGVRVEVAGVVSLHKPLAQTGPFRAEVQKLLVSPNHRYKGLAKMLMHKLEDVAKQQDRWLVMLDTTIGSGAEHVYSKLGYKQVGVIPNFAFSPRDGKLRDELFFYKDLREPGTVTEAASRTPQPQ